MFVNQSVSLLLYDNRFNSTKGFKATDLLYRSAAHFGLPFNVGSLHPASVRPWMAGDREQWLLQTLPSIKSNLVILLDASDAALFCNESEFVEKWQRLAGMGPDGRGRVLVGVEQQLWPEEQYFETRSTRCGRKGCKDTKADYPRAKFGHTQGRQGTSHMGTPFRFINIGMLAAPPADVHALLRCMQDRYAGFPRQCPGIRKSNGSYVYFSNAPHRTRFGIFSGHWGWEQSCFHTYYMEQVHGYLPRNCPELALDYRADVILNMKKTVEQLNLVWNIYGRPRINHTWLPSLRDVHPCVIHANSATKSLLPVLQLYLERMHLPGISFSKLPNARDLTTTLDAWHPSLLDKVLYPCIIVARSIPGFRANQAELACTSWKQTVGKKWLLARPRRLSPPLPFNASAGS